MFRRLFAAVAEHRQRQTPAKPGREDGPERREVAAAGAGVRVHVRDHHTTVFRLSRFGAAVPAHLSGQISSRDQYERPG